MKKLSKKSVIEIPFNWVFGLVIGVLILLIVMSFVMRSLRQEKIKDDIMLNNNLNTLFKTVMSISGELTTSINLKNPRELSFECTESGIYFSVIEEYKKRTTNDVIFVDTKLRDKTITALSIQWRVPFYVMNFLYLTTPRKIYYFCNIPQSSPYYNISIDINETIKERKESNIFQLLVNKKFIDCSTYHQLDVYDDVSITIIDFNEQGSRSSNIILPPTYIGHAKYINIIPQQTLSYKPVDIDFSNTYGAIRFEKYEGNSWDLEGTSLYYGKAMLIGAIFSQDLEFYRCSKKKSFERLNLVSKLYKERSERFYNVSTLPCKGFYNRAVYIYDQTQNLTSKILEIGDDNNIYKQLYNISINPTTPINCNKDSLYNLNKCILQYSCIYLY